MSWPNRAEFSTLVGKTIVEINGGVGDDRIDFVCEDGDRFGMHHHQGCCENVYLEDIDGDWEDILKSPVVVAEERTSGENPQGWSPEYSQDSFTWTFYTIRTLKGSLTMRWYGESNGYYSEDVDFERLK